MAKLKMIEEEVNRLINIYKQYDINQFYIDRRNLDIYSKKDGTFIRHIEDKEYYNIKRISTSHNK